MQGITLTSQRTTATGGQLTIINPWCPDDDAISPIAYRCQVPKQTLTGRRHQSWIVRRARSRADTGHQFARSNASLADSSEYRQIGRYCVPVADRLLRQQHRSVRPVK